MVTMQQIQDLSNAIVREFQPEKVILFGSYAYGTPTEDSDVDLLVVMEHEDEADVHKEVEVRRRVGAARRGFSIDLLVRTPRNLRWRIENHDWFLREVAEKGTVLYDAPRA